MRERESNCAVKEIKLFKVKTDILSNMRISILCLLLFLNAGCSAQKQAQHRMDYSLQKQEYKSRLKAVDPNSWKPVGLNVSVPTSGISLKEKGLFKTALDRNVNYLLYSFSLDHMLEPFRVRAGIPFT